MADSLHRNDVSSAIPMAHFDVASVFESSRRLFEVAAASQGHALDRVIRMNGELSRFVALRLERDRAAARELAGCGTPSEVADTYGRFFDTAVKEYAEEFGLLAGLCADQAREVVEDMQHQVEEAADPHVQDKDSA